jgi:hypothetical protein
MKNKLTATLAAITLFAVSLFGVKSANAQDVPDGNVVGVAPCWGSQIYIDLFYNPRYVRGVPIYSQSGECAFVLLMMMPGCDPDPIDGVTNAC